jgi:Xaa-Pro aminopeptidase
MSGANAATAYGAYARSTFKRLDEGELVLIHCNSFVDGYWTDITRTYCLGEPDAHRRAMYEAVFAARDAALDAICVGARAADVDAAARGELRTRGFGDAFKHPTGHGVGFAAIDHGARPMLHPRSTHVLERGMVFNVEPGIYLDGEAGLRHCDVIALEDDGPRVLTPFHDDLEALTVVHSHAGGRA